MDNNGTTTQPIMISEPPSRGLRFAIGCAILYACWSNRRLIAGWLFSTVAPSATPPDGYGSVVGITALILPLVIDFVVALGGFGIFAATFGWRILADIVQGIYSTVSNWRMGQQARAATIARIEQVYQESQKPPTESATATAGQAGQAVGVAIRDPELASFAEIVRKTLVEISENQVRFETNLNNIEIALDRRAGQRVPLEAPPPSPRVSPESTGEQP